MGGEKERRMEEKRSKALYIESNIGKLFECMNAYAACTYAFLQ